MALPHRKPQMKAPKIRRRFPAHCNFVRSHMCVISMTDFAWECDGATEVAHVRRGTDGGVGVKPSDVWTISLCAYHHRQQHQIGEQAFEKKYGIDMKDLAREFARKSPHWPKMREAMGEAQ